MRGLVAEAGPREKPHRLRTSHLQTPREATAHLRNPFGDPQTKRPELCRTPNLQRAYKEEEVLQEEEEVAKEEEEAADSSS